MFVWTASNDKAAEGQDILGETFEVDIEEDGVHEIKLTRGDVTEDGETTGADLTVPGPQLTLVYGIRDDRIAYDLYTVFGTPITEAILESGDECDVIELDDEAEPNRQAAGCEKDADLTLTLCGVAE
ncbi:hypothetical protein IMZ48_35475 [Candidatus Bathyarchaeota archaeon]|nr:hypothetical protein [Candidatus Bathyarchaeota archaeon]